MAINDISLLLQVVQYLEKHEQSSNIKKMLYYLCTSRWEQDTEYLSSIKLQHLIEQTVKESDTLSSFRTSLQNLIKTINKPKDYIETAKIIYLAIGQLYHEFRQEHIGQTSITLQPLTNNQQTEVLTKTSNKGISPALKDPYTQVAIAQEMHNRNHVESTPSINYPEPELSAVNYDSEINYTSEETSYDDEVEQVEEWTLPEYDPFILRQNVANSTNPLRAKIILIIMLQPELNFNSSTIAMLKSYQIDDLLLEVLKAFRSIQELEEVMTEAISKMVELEEYGRAANGLLQSLAPIYVQKNNE